MLQSRALRTTGLLALAVLAGLLAFYFVALQAGTPSIAPDKEQYLAGQTAILTGVDFAAAASLDIVVVRPDASIVKGDGSQTPGFDTLSSDGVGGFVYNYLTNPELTEIDGRYDVTVYATSDVAHTLPIATAIFYVDDSAYPTSITKTFAGLQLTLNGNWKWPNCASSSASKKHVGVAIDWGDGTGVANPSSPFTPSRDGVYPSDNTLGRSQMTATPLTG